MAKTATTIHIRETHKREYRRTMRRIAAGSVILWFVLALFLAGSHAGSAIVPVSIVMLIGLAAIRFSLWRRYRRDMSAELVGQDVPE
jgi:membrane protein implicated in regulation of membrane protease activity